MPSHKEKRYNQVFATSWDIEQLNIYVFNICEYDDTRNGAERFRPCPVDFFTKIQSDSPKKVEELYILKDPASDVLIYMTTFSHRNIRSQKGFLNDIEKYKNKFYLSDIEFIYVGKSKPMKDTVSFKKQKSSKKVADKDYDILWHLREPIDAASVISVKAVNVATVENKGNSDKAIPWSSMFSVPFEFNAAAYQLLGKRRTSEPIFIDKVYFVSKDNEKYKILFTAKNSEKNYLFGARKVPYFIKPQSNVNYN